MNMTLAARSVYAISAPDSDRRSWVQVMPTGEKLRNGRFYFSITAQDLETYAASIRQAAGRIPVDYDHEGDEGGPTRAAGWFTGQAQVVAAGEERPTGGAAEGDELWAEIEWTPRAVQEIRDGEYRFLSPVFTFQRRDRKTGLLTRAREIVAAALTNRPFFNLAPVTASDLLDGEVMDDLAELYGQEAAALVTAAFAGDLEAVRAAVWSTAYINDLPDSAFLYIKPGGTRDSEGKTTPRDLRMFPVRDADGQIDLPHLRNALARIPQSSLPQEIKDRLTRKAQQLLEQQGGSSAATDERTEMDITVLAKTLGLGEDADEQAVTAKVAELAARASELEQTVSELEARATVSEDLIRQAAEGAQAAKELRALKVERLVSDAVAEGKIPPVAADAYRSMAETDYEGVAKLIDAMPARSFAEIGLSGDGEPETEALVRATRERFPEADEAGLALHVQALKILGRDEFTADEYEAALRKARSSV